MNRSQQGFSFSRMIRKLFVSGFVIFTFVAYALHQHLVNPTEADTPLAGPIRHSKCFRCQA